MIYRLFVYDKRAEVYDNKGDYKTKEMATTKAKPFIDKGRKIKITSIPTNEIKIDMKLYRANGEIYGTIIDESDSFWFINRAFKDEDDKVFFLKDGFIDNYENEVFIMKDDLTNE